jgi:hypothetical protein
MLAIAKVWGKRIIPSITDEDGVRTLPWGTVACHMPGCTFVHHTKTMLKRHREQDHQKENRTLSTAWTEIRETVLASPEARVTEFMTGAQRGQMCPHTGCGVIFSRDDMVLAHHRKAHPHDHQQVKPREVEIKYALLEKHEKPAEVTVAQPEKEEDELPLGLGNRHTVEERKRDAEMWLDNLRRDVGLGAKLRHLTRKQTRLVKERIGPMFGGELLQLMEEYKDADWETYEGAIERACHEIRFGVKEAIHMKGPLYAERKMLTPEERSKLEEQNAKAKAICEVDRLTRKLRDQIELARGVAIDDEISGGRHGFMRHHKSQMNETWSRLTEILPHEETEAKWGQRKADEVVDILISNQEEGLEWLEEIRRKLLTNELYVLHRDETRRRMERVRTREEWWMDPGRTYHRYVKPIPHPQCAAEYNIVMRHFTGIWSPADILTNQFKAATRGEKWFMEGIPPEIQRTVA